ncbi:MAG: 3-oxoacid CoA-transferase subunit B [Saccharofermentanales bacterium]|jgi:acetate CoA/acetoacetate CoA-transferase beta subunit|nr:CoA transferase subunit B [Clostridiaceae bacterium]
MNSREIIARRVALEFQDGDVVNLGIGIPTLAANYLPEGVQITLQSENGMLGMGPAAEPEQATNDLTDAGGNPVTILPGGCFFDSSVSFGLIRGGHVDKTVLGALEVDANGNLANWMIPGKRVPGMGGAMDLVTGARKVIVAMEHVNRNGSPKILQDCKLPLTAKNRVSLIVTNLAVISVKKGGGLVLEELAPEVSAEEVIEQTGAPLEISPNLKPMPILD